MGLELVGDRLGDLALNGKNISQVAIIGLCPKVCVIARVNQLRRAAVRPTSLDAPIGDDETNRVADVVKDEDADTPYEQLEEKTNSALVHEMIGTLDAREQAILRQRFGLDGGDRKTLEEIGVQFGVTRERIRQIEEIALKKLRHRIVELDTVQFAA